MGAAYLWRSLFLPGGIVKQQSETKSWRFVAAIILTLLVMLGVGYLIGALFS
jgi:hypothetical protein